MGGLAHPEAQSANTTDLSSAGVGTLLDGDGKSDSRPTSPTRKGSHASSKAAASRRSSVGTDNLRVALALP